MEEQTAASTAILTAQWRVIMADDVDEQRLQTITERDALWDVLPAREITLCDRPLPEIAILSWRWDTADNQPSKNIIHAVRYAKQTDVKYMLVDVVSINQNLSGDDLLNQVLAFSELYSSVPVIAAYDIKEDPPDDNPGYMYFTYGGVATTMRRPWILHEVRKFRSNPNKITYVSHMHNREETMWKHMLHVIWNTGYTSIILGVLCGLYGMKIVSDFKYIIPTIAEILIVAQEAGMSDNDYLLTAAILCQANSHEFAVSSVDITRRHFDRYRLSEPYPPREGSLYCTMCDILLDGNKIATWTYKLNYYMQTERTKLNVSSDAEALVFSALGISRDKYQAYADQKQKDSLFLRGPEPEHQIYYVEM